MTFLVVSCRITKVESVPVYIPQDRYQYPMTNELGVAGWFVPNAVHADMMEAVAFMNEALESKSNE